ncbi:MAG: HAD family phosphatase [Anaerolineae bacterium]|nr:HAD family phosphatase [Anaerolineae bacterium]
MIKAIVFDFGGVLMRTGDPAGRREWEARLGLPAGELERIVHGSDQWIAAQRGQITPADYWLWVASHLNLAEADLPALQRDYFRDDRLDPDLIELIRELRRAGYKVGLLSNDAPPLADKLRRELAIYDLFDAVIISAFIGVMKPDPAAYQAIAAALNVQMSECVFIDDNTANIEGARAVGMQAIHYRAGMDVRAALHI